MAKRDPFIVLFVGCSPINARAMVRRGRLFRDVRNSEFSAATRQCRSPRIRAIPNAARPKCPTCRSMGLEHPIHETMSDFIEGVIEIYSAEEWASLARSFSRSVALMSMPGSAP